MSVFKVITPELDQRVENAAWHLAGKVVEQQKELVYADSRGHWSEKSDARYAAQTFWQNSQSAHAKALLEQVRADVEAYTIRALKTAAERWEAELAKELSK